MIRKAIMVGLTLAAGGVFVTGLLSLGGKGSSWTAHPADRLSVWGSMLNGRLEVGYFAIVDSAEPPVDWSGKWFGYARSEAYNARPDLWQVHFVYGPFWAPAALLALYPASAFARGRLRRYHRRRRGLCPRCGGDPTGSVSGRCPDCGTKVQAR